MRFHREHGYMECSVTSKNLQVRINKQSYTNARHDGYKKIRQNIRETKMQRRLKRTPAGFGHESHAEYTCTKPKYKIQN